MGSVCGPYSRLPACSAKGDPPGSKFFGKRSPSVTAKTDETPHPPRLSRQRRDPPPFHSLQIFGAIQKEGGRGSLLGNACNPATVSSRAAPRTLIARVAGPSRTPASPAVVAGPRATPLQPRNRRRAGVRPLCVYRCPVRRLRRVRKGGAASRASSYRATCHRTSTRMRSGRRRDSRGRAGDQRARAGLIPSTRGCHILSRPPRGRAGPSAARRPPGARGPWRRCVRAHQLAHVPSARAAGRARRLP